MDSSETPGRIDLSRRGLVALLVVALLIALLLQAALLSRGVFAVSADSSARILNAYQWTQDPTPLALVWPPLFRVVIGSALLLWPDLFITPRVVALLFGIAAVLTVAWLALELFGSRRVAATAALLAAVMPERVVLTLVPLVEMLFMVPVLLALILLWRWLGSGRPWHAICAAVLIAVASSARYEGWFFALAVAAMICCTVLFSAMPGRRTAPLVAATVAAICAAFPCYWIGLHLAQHGTLDWITQASGPRYQLLFGDSFAKLVTNTAPVQFLLANLASLNLLGLLSLVATCGQSPRLRRWILVPVAAFGLVSVLALAGKALPSHNFWRIPAVWSLLLVPFFAHWLVAVHGSLRVRGRWWGVVAVVAAALAISSACAVRIVRLTAKPSFGVHELRMARQLEAVLSRGGQAGKVLIDTSTMRYFHLQVASQYPDAFVLNTGRDPRNPASSGMVSRATGAVDLASIRERGIDHLVFRQRRAVTSLGQNPELEQVAAAGPWRLFRVLDPRPPQRINRVIRPQQIIHRTGFYRDFNWTTGHARLDHIRFTVPDSHRVLELVLHEVHPFADDTDRLAATVRVNGVELEAAGGDRRRLLFRLPPGIGEIRSVAIESATFVPHELRGSDDTRNLGIPIESITTRP